jgi:hypothetical protein
MNEDTLNLARETFLAMMPELEGVLRYWCRDTGDEESAERIAEGLALCWQSWLRQCERNRSPWRYPTAVATYAGRRVRAGRRLTGRHRAAEPWNGRYGAGEGRFARVALESVDESMLLAPPGADPAELVRSRLDYRHWLRTLTSAQKRAALILATGESTHATAKRLGVTEGAVSQMRRTLMATWLAM